MSSSACEVVRMTTGMLGAMGFSRAVYDCTSWLRPRTDASSVSRPTWLCHQPLHAIAPCQKFV